MKQLVLFGFTLLFNTAIFSQNYINEIVIEHEQIEVGAGSWIGNQIQTKASTRTLDSLNIGMIVVKSKEPDTGELVYLGQDTLYVQNGLITEMIQFQNCYKARFDQKGRVIEKVYSRIPNSLIDEIQLFQYDSLNFPMYSLKMNPGGVWLINNHYDHATSTNMENIMLPYYNALGILDSITYMGSSYTPDLYAVLKQDSYKNGDSIVITRTFYDDRNEFQRVDYFLRTVQSDTVQIRYFQDNIDQFQEYTRNYLNGLLVESYFYNRGVYNYTTKYNSLGLPVEEYGTEVCSSGDIVTYYEYYRIGGGKKNKTQLVKME